MSDLDRMLSDQLKSVGDAYRPSDLAGAQAEFLFRRRRRRMWQMVGGVALAGAAVVATILVAQTSSPFEQDAVPPAQTQEMGVVEIIEVGDAPTGISVGPGGVWVTDSESGTVTQIDSLTNEVGNTSDVGGHPDDVLADDGTVWVADPEGARLIRINPQTSEIIDDATFPGEEGKHIDLSALGGVGYGVIAHEYAVELDPEGGGSSTLVGPDPTDVAVGAEATWILGNETTQLRRYPLLLDGDPEIIDLPFKSGDNDLAVGEGYVWVAFGDKGSVVRVDPETGEVSDQIRVGGTYVGVTTGDGYAWAVSGNRDSDNGLLTRIDPATAEVVGEPLLLEGHPADVAVGNGAIWVTHESADAVSRIELFDEAPPPPPDDDEAGNKLDDILFVYSADGDIWAESADGKEVRLTDNRAREVHPTIAPDGRAVVFERDFAKLVRLDLSTGSEEVLGAGQWPSFGPDGRLAWATVLTEGEMAIGTPGAEPDILHAFDTCLGQSPCPNMVRHIVWDLEGDYVYAEVGWEESWHLFQVDTSEPDAEPFDLGEAVGYDSGEGAIRYAAPTVREPGSVHVVKTCCNKGTEDPLEFAELGVIRFTEGGPEYETVATFGSEQITTVFEYFAAPLGTMTTSDLGDSWSEGESPSWLLSEGTALWVVDASGGTYLVRGDEADDDDLIYEGVATVPLRTDAESSAIEDEAFAMWPEFTRGGAEEAATRLTAGGDTWRADAEQVAIRFMQEVFGWSEAYSQGGEPGHGGLTTVVLSRSRSEGDSSPTVHVYLDRLIADRWWSVVQVSDPLYMDHEASQADILILGKDVTVEFIDKGAEDVFVRVQYGGSLEVEENVTGGTVARLKLARPPVQPGYWYAVWIDDEKGSFSVVGGPLPAGDFAVS